MFGWLVKLSYFNSARKKLIGVVQYAKKSYNHSNNYIQRIVNGIGGNPGFHVRKLVTEENAREFEANHWQNVMEESVPENRHR